MPLVLLTGPPGTGKSTLADAAASRLDAAVLGWDWAMAALTEFEDIQRTTASMDRDRFRSIGWAILGNLATAQLRRSRSAVLDGVARTAQVEIVRRLAEESGTTSLVVATYCSDRHLHRTRVEGRTRNIPGWHELEWSHVETVLGGWLEPDGVDLRLDAASPLTENLEKLGAAIDQIR